MALTNTDYILATIFFGILFLTAYAFRRKQQSANKFLFATDDVPVTQNNSWILGFGVIELAAAGTVGAMYGLSGLYQVLIIVIASFIVVYYISKALQMSSIYDYLANKIGPIASAIYAILSMLFLLLWLSVSVMLTSKLFLSLLGWNFVNSIFGITLLSIICIEVGGNKGVKYNSKFLQTIIILAFIFIVSLVFYTLPPVDIISNLKQLAINQGKGQDFYTTFNNLQFKNIINAFLPILIIMPIITALKIPKKLNIIPITLLQIGLLILMVICGILAITTKPGNISGNSNSKIITYQAQLPDGQMGYIVKSVDSTGDKSPNMVPGIIPPMLNSKTSLVEPGKYDYKLANVVVFRHYLPASAMFLLVITLMAAFIYAVSNYLLSIAKVITIDICPPLGLFKDYGIEGKLWCSRMSVIFAGAIGIFGGYFLGQWVNLEYLAYILFGFASFLVLILLFIIVIYRKHN
jgi:Na+/proline symporter